MVNLPAHDFTSDRAGACLRGAVPFRRGGQGYMPCPPSMAGCIEAAKRGQNLQGKVGRRIRWLRPSIDLLATKTRAALCGLSPAKADRSRSRLISHTGARRNLYRADSRMNGQTHGWPGRPRRGERAKHVVLDTSRHTVHGIESPADGLSMPARPQFPKAPVHLVQ